MYLFQKLPDRFLELFSLHNFFANMLLLISLFILILAKIYNILLILNEIFLVPIKLIIVLQSIYSNEKQTIELLMINSLFESYEYLWRLEETRFSLSPFLFVFIHLLTFLRNIFLHFSYSLPTVVFMSSSLTIMN